VTVTFILKTVEGWTRFLCLAYGRRVSSLAGSRDESLASFPRATGQSTLEVVSYL